MFGSVQNPKKHIKRNLKTCFLLKVFPPRADLWQDRGCELADAVFGSVKFFAISSALSLSAEF
jgi:hypothetical protein